jgi:O-antigen/teichoic acid export membrane protein
LAFFILRNIKNKVSKNVFWLLCLNAVIAISQFTVYAVINRWLGKEVMGVWALVTAATSIGQISSFGFGNGLVRFIPELALEKNTEKIKALFGTVTVLNFILSLPFLAVFSCGMVCQPPSYRRTV